MITTCHLKLTDSFKFNQVELYYSNVMVKAMASQITDVSIAYSTVRSGANQRKQQSSASLAFVRGGSPMTGEFPAQRAGNAENVSIWCRHHVYWSYVTCF